MIFFVRTQKRHDQTNPKYKFDRKLKNIWAVLKIATIKEIKKLEELHFSGSLGNRQAQFRLLNNSNTSDQSKRYISVKMHDIKKVYLQFYMALLAQKMHKYEYDYVLTYTLAVLGVKPEK